MKIGSIISIRLYKRDKRSIAFIIDDNDDGDYKFWKINETEVGSGTIWHSIRKDRTHEDCMAEVKVICE
jgi:hypothetical protein